MVACIEATNQRSLDLGKLDLDQLNRTFEGRSPKEILAWCLDNIATGLIQSTAFGVSGMAILDLLYRELGANPPIPVLFLDTLHHFDETLELVARAQEVYDLDLHIYRALDANSREEFARRYGRNLWETDVDRFHYLTKVEPLQRGLQALRTTAWITGRRRDQSETRTNMPIFEWDSQGRLKINPLANWTMRDVWTYVVQHGVPYNVLHDRGYTSIGDEPLTTPVIAGEHERAGRWRGSVKTECGIHTT